MSQLLWVVLVLNIFSALLMLSLVSRIRAIERMVFARRRHPSHRDDR